MFRKTLLLIATAVLLTACDDDANRYAVSDAHCQPDYLKTLPADGARDSLVEKCMAR